MQKVYIKTMGCSANLYESEAMAGLIEKAGGKIVDENSSESLLVNVCTVKGNNNAIREIRKLKQKHPEKKLVVAGCITQELVSEVKKLDSGASFVSTHNIHRINEALSSQAAILMQKKPESKANLPVLRTNSLIGIVPILNGCMHACTYCSTKHVKGTLRSYPMKDVIGKAKYYVKDGCKEIWLTSQDNGCYHFDIDGKYALPNLIHSIADIEGEFFIRVGMMNPNHVLKFTDRIIESFKRDKVYKFLHIPVQSGNNEILKKMVRNYTVEEYINVVDEFKKKIRGITISTDIICGFPTETQEQFMDTVKLVKETKPSVVNISRFQSREGTVAASMEQVHGNETKKRSRLLTAVVERMLKKENRKWVGWKGKALVNERGKKSTVVARNNYYKPIVLHDNAKLGEFVNVQVVDSDVHYLIGKVSK